MSTHAQEDGFHFATVLSPFFVDIRIQDVFGGNACVSDAFPVADHPDENIGNAVLGL